MNIRLMLFSVNLRRLVMDGLEHISTRIARAGFVLRDVFPACRSLIYDLAEI